MINLNRHYTASEVIRAIEKYDSVSFDIFDTLIRRNFALPRDVFFRTAKDFQQVSGKFIKPAKFQNDRRNAERFANRILTECNKQQQTTTNNVKKYILTRYMNVCLMSIQSSGRR